MPSNPTEERLQVHQEVMGASNRGNSELSGPHEEQSVLKRSDILGNNLIYLNTEIRKWEDVYLFFALCKLVPHHAAPIQKTWLFFQALFFA